MLAGKDWKDFQSCFFEKLSFYEKNESATSEAGATGGQNNSGNNNVVGL
jgi:hypothetical protein